VSLQDSTPGDSSDPFAINTSVAHPARSHNSWLGGGDA
jgi:hypothetical protein